jgi:phosphoribosylaminoimidazolecarboxamide formyltransferase / IMP cyclohydrolase
LRLIYPEVPESPVKINAALISVYHKTGLDRIVNRLHELGVTIYSTGGTYSFLEEKGIPAEKIEDLTGYPSILGGRVKTLHPKVFGAILGRQNLEADVAEMEHHHIPAFELVIVDLYPFEDTLASGAGEDDIIEKIDIGGISLIRAAAKNFEHVLVIPSQGQYKFLENILFEQDGVVNLDQRRKMAAQSFAISSRYDALIGTYLSGAEDQDRSESSQGLRGSANNSTPLRYGENPHQKAEFIGRLDHAFEKVQGKELSFNNLVDIDAALELLLEFQETTFVIIKHTNPCGVATAKTVIEAWNKALAGDTVSAFGGILATNRPIDAEAAAGIDQIFFEVLIAADYSPEALDILMRKKNRILLKLKNYDRPQRLQKTILNGVLIQDRDAHTETAADLKVVTKTAPSGSQEQDLLFANKVAKHAKSNTIVLAKNSQLIGIGVGQTSRVDALQQAIIKAKHFKFEIKGAVMASDAFFPFPDCVQIADEAGIEAVIHPGGSIRDQDSIDYCNDHNMPMVITGYRHFKH